MWRSAASSAAAEEIYDEELARGLEQTLPHLAKRQEGVLNLARRRQLTV